MPPLETLSSIPFENKIEYLTDRRRLVSLIRQDGITTKNNNKLGASRSFWMGRDLLLYAPVLLSIGNDASEQQELLVSTVHNKHNNYY